MISTGSRMLSIILNVGGRLCGMIHTYDRGTPSPSSNEQFGYFSLSGYTLFPSQGFHYIDYKLPSNGGTHNHSHNSRGVLSLKHAGTTENFQKDSIANARA